MTTATIEELSTEFLSVFGRIPRNILCKAFDALTPGSFWTGCSRQHLASIWAVSHAIPNLTGVLYREQVAALTIDQLKDKVMEVGRAAPAPAATKSVSKARETVQVPITHEEMMALIKRFVTSHKGTHKRRLVVLKIGAELENDLENPTSWLS